MHEAVSFYESYLAAIKFLQPDERNGMQLLLKTLTGKTMTLDFASSTVSIDNVKAKIMDKKGLKLTFKNKQLQGGDTSDYNIGPGDTLTETSVLPGGVFGGGVKKHMSKKESLRSLHRDSLPKLTKIMKYMPPTDELEPVPECIQQMVRTMNAKLDETRGMMNRGEPYIRPQIKKLSDGQLENLKAITSIKSGGFTENRLYQIACVMTPEIGALELCVPHLLKLRYELCSQFVESYILEFSKEKAGTWIFDNDSFASIVDGQMKFREGYSSRIDDTRADEAPAAASSALRSWSFF